MAGYRTWLALPVHIRVSPAHNCPMVKHRITVEVIVLNDIGHVLLVRQGKTRGDWELPGGKVRAGESITHAARREVFEESNVQVNPGNVLGLFHIVEENTLDVLIAAAPETANQPAMPNPPEIVQAGWFAADQLPQPMRPFTASQIQAARQPVQPVRVIELNSKDWLGDG